MLMLKSETKIVCFFTHYGMIFNSISGQTMVVATSAATYNALIYRGTETISFIMAA